MFLESRGPGDASRVEFLGLCFYLSPELDLEFVDVIVFLFEGWVPSAIVCF